MVALIGPNINNEREQLERLRKGELLHRLSYRYNSTLFRYENVLQVGMGISQHHIETLSLNQLKGMLIHSKRDQIQQLIRKLEEDIHKINDF